MVEELYKCYEVLDKAADKTTEVGFCLISLLITIRISFSLYKLIRIFVIHSLVLFYVNVTRSPAGGEIMSK